jgi:hypothetical protein
MKELQGLRRNDLLHAFLTFIGQQLLCVKSFICIGTRKPHTLAAKVIFSAFWLYFPFCLLFLTIHSALL